MAVYPRPDYGGNPWSHWGQGIVLPDGRYVSAIGDHQGLDGNSYLFVYDPESRELVRLADVLTLVGQEPGHWGYGKIHAQMVYGPSDLVYFATYWGTRRGLEYDSTYTGDRLFALDPKTLEITLRGVPMPGHGIPSLAADIERGLLIGEAVAPRESAQPTEEQGYVFAYDPRAQKLTHKVADRRHTVFRTLMPAGRGRWFVSGDGPEMLMYEPGAEQLVRHENGLPGPLLRATTARDARGRVFGVTRSPAEFFRIDESGEVHDLGTALGYTASLALAPDGASFLHVPSAHGGAWQHGAPVIRVDGDTGAQETIVELESLAEEHLGLRLGGSFSIVVDDARRRVFVSMNAGAPAEWAAFGEVVLVEFTLP